jgi:glycosyltransferase involved in cell wall biosynthesis
VIVPTYDRPQQLARCLAALAALRPPNGGFEIIVVNDGGGEPPAEVRAAPMGHAAARRFLTVAHGGPGAARNHGARHARGAWLAFTDDDCAPEPDWLLVLEQALARAPDVLVGGCVRNALRANLFAEASQLLAEFTTRHFDGTGDRERFFASNNIALSRAAFLAAGGFLTAFDHTAEDREFCDRWHAQGRPSSAEPRAVVLHAHDLSLVSFLRQHRGYGRGARRFRAVRRDAGRPIRVDPAFYLGSIRHALGGRPFTRGAVLAALILAAHGAYLAGLAPRPAVLSRPTPNPE